MIHVLSSFSLSFLRKVYLLKGCTLSVFCQVLILGNVLPECTVTGYASLAHGVPHKLYDFSSMRIFYNNTHVVVCVGRCATILGETLGYIGNHHPPYGAALKKNTRQVRMKKGQQRLLSWKSVH